MNNLEIADILQEVVSSGKLKASKEQWKIINDLINCRTSALGGHLYQCQDCGTEQPRYNSCRNRHCPKCQKLKSAEWLDARAKELLDVPYFHLVFTLPHELNGIVLQNKKTALGILFKAVAKTLSDVARTRLDGRLGFISVLHTWGQKLDAHFHLHCVIPGVSIKADGSAEKLSSKYLLPQRVLSTVFRAIYCKMLQDEYKELIFSGAQEYLKEKKTFDNLLKQACSKEWVVYAKKPFAGPETVLCYLSRYTHRVAISNSRLLACENGKTTFTYKDYSKKAKRSKMTLNTTEFVRRFLLHALPKGFTRIRYYGFLASAVRTKKLVDLKEKLGIAPQGRLSPPKKPATCCSHCSSESLVYIRKIPRKIIPFKQSARKTPSPKSKQLPLVA